MSAVTVLVVDDDPVILQLLRVNFELEGYEVVTAADGEEGVQQVRAQQPDVVISDVMMPRYDGMHLVRALKDDPATAGLPIILLSAKAQSDDVTKGLELGVDDYVTKPFDPLELVERVNDVLSKSR